MDDYELDMLTKKLCDIIANDYDTVAFRREIVRDILRTSKIENVDEMFLEDFTKLLSNISSQTMFIQLLEDDNTGKIRIGVSKDGTILFEPTNGMNIEQYFRYCLYRNGGN